MPYERKKRYMDLNVKENDAQTIIKEKSISDYFDKCLALNIDAVMASNWLCVNIIGYSTSTCSSGDRAVVSGTTCRGFESLQVR